MTVDGNAMREARMFLEVTARDVLVTALDVIFDLDEVAQHAREIGDEEAGEVLERISDNAHRENYGATPLPPHPAQVAAWN